MSLDSILSNPDLRSFIINIVSSIVFALVLWLGRRLWFVGAILLATALLVEAFNWPPSAWFVPIPRALYSLVLAAGGSGILSWYVRTRISVKNELLQRPNIAEILAVYPNGMLNNASLLEEGKTIDILGISLRGLLDIQAHLKRAIEQNNAAVRILVISPRSRFIREREKQENIALRRGQITKETEATIGRTKEIALQISAENAARAARGASRIVGSIELKCFDTLPYCSCAITDKQIRYTPYLLQDRAGYSPTFDVNITGEIAGHIRGHFENLWNNSPTEFKETFG